MPSVLILFIIVLDQITKWLSLSLLHYHEPVAVLPGLNWFLAYNTGAAFNFLSDGTGWQRWLFVGIGVGVTGILLVWLTTLKPNQWLEKIAFSVIIGGALGNVSDRLFYGYVIDFIDVYYKNMHWPTFNVADSAICIGTGLYCGFLFPGMCKR